VNPIPKNVVDVLSGIFLTGGDIGYRGLGNATAIKAPTLGSIANFDDVSLGKIFGPIFIGRNGNVENFYGAVRFAAMIELTKVSLERDVLYVKVRRSAKPEMACCKIFCALAEL
jgi:hypothetical protein